MSVLGAMLRSYRAPRAVMRCYLDEGRREDRALAWLVGACALMFMAQWPRLAREAHLNVEIPQMGYFAAALFGWLFLAPLLFYGLAILLHFATRLVSGRSSAYAARVATFWPLLAASPVWMLQGLAFGLWGAGTAATLLGLTGIATYVGMVVSGLREAALEPPAASA